MHLKPCFSSTTHVFLVPGIQGDMHTLIDSPSSAQEASRGVNRQILRTIPIPEWPEITLTIDGSDFLPHKYILLNVN